MRTTFAPFVLIFIDFDPLEWGWLVSLGQQLFQFGSRYWIHSVELFPLGLLSLAGLDQTCLRELVRGHKTDVFGTLASLLWSVLVAHAAISVKSDQRVCLVPLAVLLSVDEANSRSGNVTAPPVIGKRGALIRP